MMPHALDVPDITDHIAPFLTNKSLFQCILVSRHFYIAFLPSLWETVSLFTVDTRTGSLSEAALASISRHASLIRTLALNNLESEKCLPFLALEYPSLHTIDIFSTAAMDGSLQQAIKALVQRQAATLRTLRLDIKESAYFPLTNNILDSCKNHDCLRVLDLKRVSFRLDEPDQAIQHILRNLTSLSIQQVYFHRAKELSPSTSISTTTAAVAAVRAASLSYQEPTLPASVATLLLGAPPSDRDFALDKKAENDVKSITTTTSLGPCRIQHLDFGYNIGLDTKDMYELIVACRTDLCSLAWSNSSLGLFSFAKDLRRFKPTAWWPQLCRLNFSHSHLSDESLAKILVAMGTTRRLKELNASFTKFGVRSTRALLFRDDLLTFDESNNSEMAALSDDMLPHHHHHQQERQQQQQQQQQNQQCPHRLALEGLFLSSTPSATGSMLQQFLCAFPNLRLFQGVLLTETDLEHDPRPWVCRNLQTLDITLALVSKRKQRLQQYQTLQIQQQQEQSAASSSSYSLSPSSLSSSTVMLHRLSELTKLEELALRKSAVPEGHYLFIIRVPDDNIDKGDGGDDKEALNPLRVRVELKKLKSLTRMRRVTCSNRTSSNPRRPRNRLISSTQLNDVEWMVRAWPLLETVWIDPASFVAENAVKLLKSKGIRIDYCQDKT